MADDTNPNFTTTPGTSDGTPGGTSGTGAGTWDGPEPGSPGDPDGHPGFSTKPSLPVQTDPQGPPGGWTPHPRPLPPRHVPAKPVAPEVDDS